MDFRQKHMLAPMVRISTLPSRLQALEYGADIVYCEEIIDFKILQADRVENAVLGTVDFILKDGTVVFRTCEKEKDSVVFQMGTSDAKRALAAAKKVEKDVAVIDINMGCPKEFSVKGGMGAALLTQPEKIQAILTTLVAGLTLPVTCKIRILPKLEDTLKLVKLIESCGVAAIGVHGRLKEERPRHANHNDIIKAVVEAVKVPIIANGGSGEIKCYEDIIKFKENTGTTSVMLARAAQWNMSIFRKGGMLPIDTVIKDFLKHAIDYDSVMANAKYCVQQVLHEELDTPVGRSLLGAATLRQIWSAKFKEMQAAKSLRQICEIWDMSEYFDSVLEKHKLKSRELDHHNEATSTGPLVLKKRKLEDGTELFEMPLIYNRKEYGQQGSKVSLFQHTRASGLPKPTYDTIAHPSNKTFFSIVTVGGKKYASKFWDKSKKCAEQAAATVGCRALGVYDGHKDGPELFKIKSSHLAEVSPKMSEHDSAGEKNGSSGAVGGNSATTPSSVCDISPIGSEHVTAVDSV